MKSLDGFDAKEVLPASCPHLVKAIAGWSCSTRPPLSDVESADSSVAVVQVEECLALR